MSNLRSKIIRLAHANPHLRTDLLPLLENKVARKYLKKASIVSGSLNIGVEVICNILGTSHKGKVLGWNDRTRQVQVELSSGQKIALSYDDVTLATPIEAPFDPDQMLRQLRKEISNMKFPKSMPVTKIYLEHSNPHRAVIHFTGYQSSKVTQRIGKLKIMKKLGFEYSSSGGVKGSLVLNDGSGYNYTIEFYSSGSSSQDTDLWYKNEDILKRNQWGW